MLTHIGPPSCKIGLCSYTVTRTAALNVLKKVFHNTFELDLSLKINTKPTDIPISIIAGQITRLFKVVYILDFMMYVWQEYVI